MEIYFHLDSPPCHSSSGNENKDKSKLIKPECGKFYWVRYELQCERGGTTIKVLPAMCKKKMILRSIYIFEVCLKGSIYIYTYIYIHIDR